MAAMITFVAVAGLVVAAVQTSTSDLVSARRSVDDVRASALAESGVEIAKAELAAAAKLTSVNDPLSGVRSFFDDGSVGSTGLPIFGSDVVLADATPLTSNGANIGEYTTTASIVTSSSRQVIVEVVSTGYVPAAPQNLRDGERLESWDSITVTLNYEVSSSAVFDNAYFVNNWGWLYGNTITINGNARSNGQMDIGGYRPTINGQPLYDSLDWDGTNATLGASTGDGGLSSAWEVVNDQNAQGPNNGSANSSSYEEQVEMPNLTDLSRYEDMAHSESSTISVGGQVVASEVVGDSPGESQNLYLIGTASDPIVLNGPVVVRGDVMISGVVTGQGSIYSGGNTYVPNSISYANGPSDSRPSDDSRQATEEWIENSMGDDFLGLFASENIIVGDFTHRTWDYYVSGWLANSQNSSEEDAGTDLVPHTAAGRDGILGTADDDYLEGDGVFSVEYYSQADADAGTIPDGYTVGDAVPGSGEDIDGDGQYDDTITTDEFDFDDDLDPAYWEGNMPAAGFNRYSDVASMYTNQLDGVFYTNHAFSWVVFGSQTATLNGSMVARNENIVYGTPKIEFNYDARMIGGGGGILGNMLPLTLRPVEVLQWRRNEEDPHRAAVTVALADTNGSGTEGSNGGESGEGSSGSSGSSEGGSTGSGSEGGSSSGSGSETGSGGSGSIETGTSGGRGRGNGGGRGNRVGR